MIELNIFLLFAFLSLHIISHYILLKNIKQLKYITSDILDELEDLTMDDRLLQNELEEIKDRLSNLTYNNRHQ